jgi:hypothetical protein
LRFGGNHNERKYETCTECQQGGFGVAHPLPWDGFAQKLHKFDALFVQPVILHKNGVERELTTLSGG